MPDETYNDHDVLEALRRARARIESANDDPDRGRVEWKFSNWTTCTCGHIYAATGEEPDGHGFPIVYPAPQSLYERVLEEILAVHPTYRKSDDTLAEDVSQLTEDLYDSTPPATTRWDERAAALELIDETIEAIEQRHEDARQRLVDEQQDELMLEPVP